MPIVSVTPLSARSIIASTLLGTLPPRLPGRLLVAFAEEFGVNPGTARVALSRMVDGGELTREDEGVYGLAGALLARQTRQEAGLMPSPSLWSGDWTILVVNQTSRESADRSALRRAATHLGFGERREGVWMRPANLPVGRLVAEEAIVAAQTDRFTGRPADIAPQALVDELFPLAEWAELAARLVQAMTEAPVDDTALAEGFELSAAVLRHLVADPLLPVELWPTDWPAAVLRDGYAAYNVAFRHRLSAFFRSRSRVAE
ncbi:MAG: phenylacetic acid degradation operon negative regulatory protein [Candidatus Aldehydirespiratoraceae bacterium]|jgi:phenylacetic acid degradation operon negative regulatory protein